MIKIAGAVAVWLTYEVASGTLIGACQARPRHPTLSIAW
jgi:hypothetical protein